MDQRVTASGVSGLALPDLHETLRQRRYGVEYQPIVSVADGEIVAYEALARFYRADGGAVPPLEVFEALHDNPRLLHRTEVAMKRLQIERAPTGFDLFLNLDPHAMAYGGEGGDAMIDAIGRDPRLVVELIENSDIHDARASESLYRKLSERGIRTALDDIGAPHALLSLELISLVDYLKFDRSWLGNLHRERHRRLFSSLVEYARRAGKRTVLEGVEDAAALALARRFSIDYVQGFLYRPRFISSGPAG